MGKKPLLTSVLHCDYVSRRMSTPSLSRVSCSDLLSGTDRWPLLRRRDERVCFLEYSDWRMSSKQSVDREPSVPCPWSHDESLVRHGLWDPAPSFFGSCINMSLHCKWNGGKGDQIFPFIYDLPKV
jgi:hypothetical protein